MVECCLSLKVLQGRPLRSMRRKGPQQSISSLGMPELPIGLKSLALCPGSWLHSAEGRVRVSVSLVGSQVGLLAPSPQPEYLCSTTPKCRVVQSGLTTLPEIVGDWKNYELSQGLHLGECV